MPEDNSDSPVHLRAPERLTARHDVSSFDNGKHPSLDVWLRERALTSEGLSARTYVICNAATPNRVVRYYAISTAMEQRIALAAQPTFALDRLSRYEHLLWRQAGQIVFTLEPLRHRKRQPSRSSFPFSFRRRESSAYPKSSGYRS